MKHRSAGPWFVAPFLILFALFFITPLGYAAYLSFFQHKLIGGTVFVGLDNYVKAIADPQFLRGVLRVAHPNRTRCTTDRGCCLLRRKTHD